MNSLTSIILCSLTGKDSCKYSQYTEFFLNQNYSFTYYFQENQLEINISELYKM